MSQPLGAKSRPSWTYQEALARIETLRSKDTGEIRRECRVSLLSHGEKTPGSVVLIHGLSSCPEQFRKLGERFFSKDFNVLLPRLPHHGLSDPLTTAQSNMTVEDLIDLANESIDIACGLGEVVHVVGFSTGGTVAGWIAQNRSEGHRVTMIAPCFGIRPIPKQATPFFAQLSLRLPGVQLWWNPLAREQWNGPQHVYPRFSSHALARVLQLGLQVRNDASSHPPRAANILSITNANDPSVNNAATREIMESWKRHGVTSLKSYEFPWNLGLIHDLLDPAQPGEQAELVHPQLLDLILAN